MAREAVEAGFTQAKFDIDYLATDVPSDVWNRSITTAQINRAVERLGIVRETVGRDFEICADCHRQYNVPDSIRCAQALAPLNLLWLEDPTPQESPHSTRAVVEKSPISICFGEIFIAEQFWTFIELGACDILHPD